MKRIKIVVYISIGIFLSVVTNNFLYDITHATTNQENEIIEKNITSKSENISNAKLSHYPNFIEASEKAINSVVHIKSKYLSNEIYGYYDPFYGRRYYKQPQENIASGSGVIISNDGYIITNNHVINNAKEIEIVLNDKRSYSAEILGVDPDSDLALLKIDEENLNFLKFADSDNLKVGEWVLAIGNPYNLNSTVTAGIVSAKSRKINILNSGGIEAFIQTDAAINSGNSGGALVNTNGDLIGINTAIQSKTGAFSGYGFAIPSNMANKIVNDLKKYGEVRRAFIGIHIADINQSVQRELKLNNLEGVLISKVLKNSAAEQAGLKNFDIITKINGVTVNSTSELHELIIQCNPGEEIKCTIKRNNKILDFSIALKA